MRFHSRRGGVVLDLVVGAGLVLIAAYTLDRLGFTLVDLLTGARHFFGV